MIDQIDSDAASGVADIPDGTTVQIGGFGRAGQPVEVIRRRRSTRSPWFR